MADDSGARNHAHRLTVFSVSATMVGVCLTGVGIIGVVKSMQGIETAVDELLAVSAVLFGVSSALYFWALRRVDQSRRHLADHMADSLFFLALGLLLVACVMFVIGFKAKVTSRSVLM
ncbi:MAG TPA: hypothetical protein VIY86_11280 [Pirellulaceae bacterium]